MKENRYLKVKQRVELHIFTKGSILNLSTHIEHVTEDGKFIVAAPFYQGQLYPFLAREHVELYAVIEGAGVVSCDVLVEKRLRNGKIVLLLLERISDIKKTQRRKHFRLPTLLETEITAKLNTREPDIHAVAKDISAGGIKCITPEKLAAKEIVSIKMDLNGEKIEVDSSVLDSLEVSTENVRFETRFEFAEMELKQERIIVAYIFDEQRKRRRR